MSEGKPDAGNLPRTDPETMQGIVTDVYLKRKVRDYVVLAGDRKVYVEHKGVALNTQNRRAFAGIDVDPKNATSPDRKSAREWMCANFYDVRMFGAVLATGQKEGLNAGQVRVPCSSLSSAASTRCCPRTSRSRAWR